MQALTLFARLEGQADGEALSKLDHMSSLERLDFGRSHYVDASDRHGGSKVHLESV